MGQGAMLHKPLSVLKTQVSHQLRPLFFYSIWWAGQKMAGGERFAVLLTRADYGVGGV
jgi:hypothetical protein